MLIISKLHAPYKSFYAMAGLLNFLTKFAKTGPVFSFMSSGSQVSEPAKALPNNI